MANILITYSTIDGHTQKICKHIQESVESVGNHKVTIIPLNKAMQMDLEPFDKLVLGASIRYGKHRPLIFEFIEKNLALLNSKPSAFFSVNVVARKPEKNRPETNPYFQKFLKQSLWTPKVQDVFAGQIDYPRYGFFDRLMIRFIMKVTHGPTDTSGTFEFTDWDRVEGFAKTLAKM